MLCLSNHLYYTINSIFYLTHYFWNGVAIEQFNVITFSLPLFYEYKNYCRPIYDTVEKSSDVNEIKISHHELCEATEWLNKNITADGTIIPLRGILYGTLRRGKIEGYIK